MTSYALWCAYESPVKPFKRKQAQLIPLLSTILPSPGYILASPLTHPDSRLRSSVPSSPSTKLNDIPLNSTLKTLSQSILFTPTHVHLNKETQKTIHSLFSPRISAYLPPPPPPPPSPSPSSSPIYHDILQVTSPLFEMRPRTQLLQIRSCMQSPSFLQVTLQVA